MKKIAPLKNLQPTSASRQKIEDPFQKEEISKWTRDLKRREQIQCSAQIQTLPPLNSLYISAGLSLLTLESGGRAANTETLYLQMKKTAPQKTFQPTSASHQKIEDPFQKEEV